MATKFLAALKHFNNAKVNNGAGNECHGYGDEVNNWNGNREEANDKTGSSPFDGFSARHVFVPVNDLQTSVAELSIT